MIVTTTQIIEGELIGEYRGLVSGEAILNANIFRAVIAGVLELPGVRLTNYAQSLESAREEAMQKMMQVARDRGANAVVGVDIDYKSIHISDEEYLVLVTATGTAARYIE